MISHARMELVCGKGSFVTMTKTVWMVRMNRKIAVSMHRFGKKIKMVIGMRQKSRDTQNVIIVTSIFKLP